MQLNSKKSWIPGTYEISKLSSSVGIVHQLNKKKNASLGNLKFEKVKQLKKIIQARKFES